MDIDQFVTSKAVLDEACAAIGRDPSEIMTSQHIIHDPEQGPAALAEAVAERLDIGLDLAVIYLPPPHSPAVLAPLATALADIS